MPERMPSMPMGQLIRQTRQTRGWSLANLAERAGISRSYLHQIEQGASTPTEEKIVKLAEALGVLPSELFGENHREVDIPQSLQTFAQESGLGSAEIQMLARIEYRGQRPSTVDEWKAIYAIIKGMLEK